MKPKIVAFIGVIGSGKDYKADKLKTEKGYVRVDFKDELLDMVSDLIGYNVRDEYEWFKHAIVGFRKPKDPLQEAMKISEMKDILKGNPEAMTGRRLLTRLGTEVMRKRDQDYWVRALIKRIEHLAPTNFSIAIADCRFRNEVAGLISYGLTAKYEVQFIFSDFHSQKYNPTLDHESERMAQEFLQAGYKDLEEIPYGAERLYL